MRLQIVTFTLLQALAIAGPIDKVGNRGLTATGDGLQSVAGGVNVGEPICALGRGLVATSSKATEGHPKGNNDLDHVSGYKLDISKSREERYWDAVEELAKFCEKRNIRYAFAQKTVTALRIFQTPPKTDATDNLPDPAKLTLKPSSKHAKTRKRSSAKTGPDEDPLGRITIMAESVVALTAFVYIDCRWAFNMDRESPDLKIEYRVYVDNDKESARQKEEDILFRVSVVHTTRFLDSDTELREIPGRPGVQLRVCRDGRTFIALPPPQPAM